MRYELRWKWIESKRIPHVKFFLSTFHHWTQEKTEIRKLALLLSHWNATQKKSTVKWNKTVSSSLYHGVSVLKTKKKQTGSLFAYTPTQTTREFNDNRKMVFPCFYLNMLSSGVVRFPFAPALLVDNMFCLAWQVLFFPFTCKINIFLAKC